jgi:hypothetical protein
MYDISVSWNMKFYVCLKQDTQLRIVFWTEWSQEIMSKGKVVPVLN